MRRILKYYKWHLLLLLLVIMCLIIIFVSTSTKTEADLIVGYTGTQYINVQKFDDNKSELELLLKDVNKDGKKHAEIFAFTGDLQHEIDDAFSEMIETEAYHIYIVEKQTLLNYKDKSVFADLSGYVSDKGNINVLTDSKKRVYAVSLKDNTLAERLGVVNTGDIYIAAARYNDNKISDFEKNGMNISGYIIDSKDKYNY